MADGSFLDGAGAVLDTHNVYRLGTQWTCRYCRAAWPYPAPVPAGPCVPRAWGDGEPEPTTGRAHPHGAGVQPAWNELLPNSYTPEVLLRECTDCGAEQGERCIDRRKTVGTKLRPHRKRRVQP